MGEELGPEAWKPHSQLPRSWPPRPVLLSRRLALLLTSASGSTCSRLLSYWVPSAWLAAPSSCLAEAVCALHAASPLGCVV